MSNDRRLITHGYENVEGPLHRHDDETNELIIDFTGDAEAMDILQKAKNVPAPNDIDLGTGFPSHLIWTTKDGRRIPIPHMADSHLQNTIAFLRRRVEPVYKRKAIAMICQGVAHTAFVNSRLDLSPGEEEFVQERMHKLKGEALERGKKIFAMDEDTFLREFSPQFPYLLQEAYRRKLIIEVDSGKLS